MLITPLVGHSCNIGNVPNLVEKNWKLCSVCFWCISVMFLYLLKWENQGASLNFVPTHLFGKIWDSFVPGTYWQFLVKSHVKAWISIARPWKSHYNLLIKHINWKSAFTFKFSIIFDFFGWKVNWKYFPEFCKSEVELFSRHVLVRFRKSKSCQNHLQLQVINWTEKSLKN